MKGKMPMKGGKHKMPGGGMMSDAEMKKMMSGGMPPKGMGPDMMKKPAKKKTKKK